MVVRRLPDPCLLSGENVPLNERERFVRDKGNFGDWPFFGNGDEYFLCVTTGRGGGGGGVS